MEKIALEDLDFRQVQEIYEKLSKGDFSTDIWEHHEHQNIDAALQILREDQLRTIGSGCLIEYKLKIAATSEWKEERRFKALNDAYKELDRDTKYELVGLFHRGEIGNLSPQFFDGSDEVQSLVYSQYLQLLDQDKLNIECLTKDYISNNPLFYLTDLKESLFNHQKELGEREAPTNEAAKEKGHGVAALIAAVTTLFFMPFIALNSFGGIAAGIWLIWIGNWSALFWGIGIGVGLPFLLAFLLMPGLFVALPGAYLRSKGLTPLALPFLFLGGFWTYGLMAYVAIGVYLFFIEMLGDQITSIFDFVMVLLWSYAAPAGAWNYMASKEQSSSANMAAFFSNLIGLGLGIAIFLFKDEFLIFLYLELPGMMYVIDWLR